MIRRLTIPESIEFGRKFGVHPACQRRAGLALARISNAEPGRFRFDETAPERYVMPTSPDLEASDLLTFDPGGPTRFRLFVGDASWLVGRDAEAIRFEEAGLVRLWRDPMSFMRHGCQGAVPLSAGCAVALTHGLDVEAEDEAHAGEIKRAMWRGLARITVSG